MAAVKPIPEGFHTVNPFLLVRGAEELARWIERAFGARVAMVRDGNGVVQHVEATIGDSKMMINECPPHEQPMPAGLYLYVENVDAAWKRAMGAGAQEMMPLEDQFWGDRAGGMRDRWGNAWFLASRIEKVDVPELERRLAAGSQQGAPA